MNKNKMAFSLAKKDNYLLTLETDMKAKLGLSTSDMSGEAMSFLGDHPMLPACHCLPGSYFTRIECLAKTLILPNIP